MNLFEQFIKKQNEIAELTNQTINAQNELKDLKRQVWKKFKEKFKAKPIGKTVIKKDGFEIVYNCTQKISLLTNEIERDKVEFDCFIEKVTPEKRTLALDKKEFKKMDDEDQAKVKKYLMIENNEPTINVLMVE